MTRHHIGDEARTNELVENANDDVSWLRHRGLAAELDRRLLQGATEAELAEVRSSWMGHIAHLRAVHHVLLVEQPRGFWRITGAEPAQNEGDSIAPLAARASEMDAALVDEEADAEEAEEAEEAIDPAVADTPAAAGGPSRIGVTARALAALAARGLMADPLLKASVGMLIRQASESHHWHNCAHFRSADVRRLVDEQELRSPSQYQAFCRSNFRHEHVVPNSVIYRMLCKTADVSARAIESLLDRYCIRATITLEENAALNRLGLASGMPSGFWQPGHPLHDDPLARYKAAGLFERLERRGDELWFPQPR